MTDPNDPYWFYLGLNLVVTGAVVALGILVLIAVVTTARKFVRKGGDPHAEKKHHVAQEAPGYEEARDHEAPGDQAAALASGSAEHYSALHPLNILLWLFVLVWIAVGLGMGVISAYRTK